MWDADVARGAIDEPFYVEHGAGGPHRRPARGRAARVYLCSDDAAYVTGGLFTIDGGLTSIPAG